MQRGRRGSAGWPHGQGQVRPELQAALYSEDSKKPF